MFSKTKKVYTIQAEPINGSPRSEASGSPRSEASGSPRSEASSTPSSPRFNFKSLTSRFMGSKNPSPSPSPSPTTTLTLAEQEELRGIKDEAEKELEITRDVVGKFNENWKKEKGSAPMTSEDLKEQKRLVRVALINAGFTDGFNTGGKTRKRRGSRRRKRRGSRRHKRRSKRSRR